MECYLLFRFLTVFFKLCCRLVVHQGNNFYALHSVRVTNYQCNASLLLAVHLSAATVFLHESTVTRAAPWLFRTRVPPRRDRGRIRQAHGLAWTFRRAGELTPPRTVPVRARRAAPRRRTRASDGPESRWKLRRRHRGSSPAVSVQREVKTASGVDGTSFLVQARGGRYLRYRPPLGYS